MSEKNPGLLDELKKWLEFEEPEAEEGTIDIRKLQDQLAMESDPEKRKAIKAQIRKLTEDDERAETPTNLLGGSY